MPSHHLYILTKPLPTVTRDLPLFFCFEERIYGREDVGGLLIGFFDKNAIPVSPSELPKDFSFGLLDSNWAQIGPNMETAIRRFPDLEQAEIRLLLNGPESFTPDLNMLLGEVPGKHGCFVAAAMNSSGIGLSPAVGRLTAEWMLGGRPSLDIAHLDVRRFSTHQSNERYLRRRVSEAVTHMCILPFPGHDFRNTRGIRRSALHDLLLDKGARYGSTAQWEVPLWFNPDRLDEAAPCVRCEIGAAEEAVALFDLSSDCKLCLEGPGAETLLRRLSGAVGNVAIGGVILAPMLNEGGGVEALPTIARLSRDAWLVLADADQATRLTDWIARHRGEEEARLADLTSAWAGIGLAGPRASTLLKDPPDAFVKEAELGYASVLILPWLGTGGRHIMVSTEFAAGLLEHLIETGEPLGLRPAGQLAVHALMLKAGMPRYGSEASSFRSAVALGLDRYIRPDASADFIGRAALLADRAHSPARLESFVLDTSDDIYSFANLPILDCGNLIGYATSGAFIPSLGHNVVMALLTTAGEPKAPHILIAAAERPLRRYFTPDVDLD